MKTKLTDLERLALDWLVSQGGLASAFAIRKEPAWPHPEDAAVTVASLVALGLVERRDGLTGAHWYEITEAGREQLASEPAQADGCGEAHGARCTVNGARETSRATVCIDEADLDDWWDELDVELKSAAFLNYSFGAARSEVSVEDRVTVSVPIVGSVGESPEQWNALAAHMAPLKGIPETTACYYCHESAPGSLFLRSAPISRLASVLRRVCSKAACFARWRTDSQAMRDAVARGEELGGEPLDARPNLQDAEKAGD